LVQPDEGIRNRNAEPLKRHFRREGFLRIWGMKMRIKKDFLPCFLPAIAVLCFVFLSPAFAEITKLQKLSECALARNNASRTGQLITTQQYPYSAEDDWPDCKVLESFDSTPEILTPDMNWGDHFSVHDDYGYDWLRNVNYGYGWLRNLYFEASAPSSPLTVEAGRYGDTTYVTIGLGSQEVELNSWDKNVTLGSSEAPSTSTTCCMNCLCSIHLDGLEVKTNGSSYVTMYKHDGQIGVNVNVDATIDRISLATLSLGDCDGDQTGKTAYNQAGYVGLKDTGISDVTVLGSLSIGVGTVGGNLKSVHMGFNKLNVGMSSLHTTVVLGKNKYFSGTEQVLGTIYMSGLNIVDMSGYLDIYNPAGNSAATTFAFGIEIPSLTMAYVLWGDPDGFNGAASAGYWGWKNLTIKDLGVMGQATFYSSTISTVNNGTNLPSGTTVANIALNNLNISVAYISRDIVISKSNSPDNINQITRSVSWSGVNVNINGLVQIGAH